MRYKKRKLNNLNLQRKAIDILHQKMMFYSDDAILLATSIINKIKETSNNGKLLVEMQKELLKIDALAIDCAAKLAPYQNPKLNTVEVKKKTTHRFVIEAPKRLSTEDWIKNVTYEHSLLPKQESMKLINPPKEIKDEDDYEYNHFQGAN